MSFQAALTPLKDHLVPNPEPLAGRQTIQIVLIREIQDYTILRTEETREINTVVTAGLDDKPVERVAFLATKQKGAESRQLEDLLRTWGTPAKSCFLKSGLCLECPRCILFGATDVAKGTEKGANIKHRIAYATAFSLLPADDLRTTHTFNGVDGATQLTGQTLGERESVRPGSLFASIVTLRAVTENELVLALKSILACTRYGAESRIGGVVRNHVRGIVGAYEEVLSPLELTIEINRVNNDASFANVSTILEEYKKKAGMSSKVAVLTVEQTKALVTAVQERDVDAPFLTAAYTAAKTFRTSQASFLKKAKD
jgi:CRISPR type I-D-associated protein Csc2